MKLSNKVALVTGGTSGIGEAIVRLFASEGAAVVCCARRPDAGHALEDEMRANGHSVDFLQADVSDEDAVQSLVAQTIERHGRLDIVVNNAGTAPAGPLEQMAVADWDDTMRANVTSMFLVTKYSIPHLREAGRGSVINLGSTFGAVGAPGSAAYAVTKAAAISLSKSLAAELASDNIRVNALCPGATDTPFLRDWFVATGAPSETEQWLVEHHPLGRLGQPEEQARGALFLASDDSSFVTGSALFVDGGYTAI